MPLPTSPKPKARSISELLAAQKAAKAVPVDSDPTERPNHERLAEMHRINAKHTRAWNLAGGQKPIPPESLPFGGASLEQLAHESQVAALHVPRSWASQQRFLSVQSYRPMEQLVPDDPHSYVDVEPHVNQAEFIGVEDGSKPGEAPAQTIVHDNRVIHVHAAPKNLDQVHAIQAVAAAAIKHMSGLPRARIIPATSPEAKPLIAAAVASADAAIADSNKLLSLPHPETVEENIDGEAEKLERLIDDNFPFDDTQLAAVHGMVTHQFATMIGEAGTGKTTVTKKLVDLLKEGVAYVDLSGYWKRGESEDDGDYETPTNLIPSIVMVSFTGRASQMVKKNFPSSWHPNIMTIHRALGFYPEFYEDEDAEGNVINKKRFVPAYTAANPMPWKIIIIDEAGMLGTELWHQLLAATLPETRIYMIGDIRQLPPTHGKSILGFALAKWPVYALTHVHRQKGVNNSIVDNAHRVMNGLMPICDSTVFAKDDFPKGMSFVGEYKKIDGVVRETQDSLANFQKTLRFLVGNKDWRFLKIRVDENPDRAQHRIRQVMKLLFDKSDLYEPNRDIIITPTNGFEPSAPGYKLGQFPLNQGLVNLLNSGAQRYLIDAGRERQNFAIGDKVMATVNDYAAGITNGMTGIVDEIRINDAYTGNAQKYGRVEDVAKYFEAIDSDEDEDDFDLNDMIQAGREALAKQEKEQRDTGPASHTIIVRFGEGEHAFTVDFYSKSQVASLMLAYAATCHKMQGGEAPLVFVIVHGTQKKPLNREWLYTAITRASGRCVLLYTGQGLGTALAKKAIEGKTIEDKIKYFVKLSTPNSIGAAMKIRLPEPRLLAEVE